MTIGVIESLVWLDQKLPFRRRSGARAWLPPTAVTDGYDVDPVIAVDTGHVFVDRGVEFLLIALLQLAMLPIDSDDWAALYRAPPSPEDLASALAPYREALDLVHPTHPMLQVRPNQDAREALKSSAKRPRRGLPAAGGEGDGLGEESIAELLPDRPTSNDSAKNKDVFVKRKNEVTLDAGVVGALLYSHIVLFPLGGGGYFSLPHGAQSVKFSLIGDTLWHSLWLNVIGADDPLFAAESQIGPTPRGRNSRAVPVDGRSFAWLRPELPSSSLARGTRLPVLQHQFSLTGVPMQRRYLLDPPREGRCDLTGAAGPVFATYARWPGGLDFSESGWSPLCVAERKSGKPDRRSFVSVGPRPLRLDDLLDLPIAVGPSPPDGSPNLPALRALLERATVVGEEPTDISVASDRLHATLRATALGGDNVAEFFSERIMPLYRLPEEAGARMLGALRESGEALRKASDALVKTAKAVLQPRDRDRQQDRKLASYLGDSLALRMEGVLAHMITELARTDAPVGHGPAMKQEFITAVRQECLVVFDTAFPLPAGDSEATHVAIGRRRLRQALHRSFGERPSPAVKEPT